MPQVPIQPRLKSYRGANEATRRQVAKYNAMAIRVADHINRQIANDPSEHQQYLFGFVAIDLGLTKEQVRSAIEDGGFNGITLAIHAMDRLALEPYK